jgi:hypothetical protein
LSLGPGRLLGARGGADVGLQLGLVAGLFDRRDERFRLDLAALDGDLDPRLVEADLLDPGEPLQGSFDRRVSGGTGEAGDREADLRRRGDPGGRCGLHGRLLEGVAEDGASERHPSQTPPW